MKIVDAAGRTVLLPAVPRRIVVVGYAPFIALDIIYLFPEARERLVGYEQKIKPGSNSFLSFLSLVDPNFEKKAILQGEPGPENIAALRPDLVIAKGRVETSVGRSLAPLGIPVVYLDVENPDLFLADIENLGKIFNNEPRAREIVNYYRERLGTVAKTIASVPKNERPSVLVLLYSDRTGTVSVQVPAEDWFQTAQATLAGGMPVWLESVARDSQGWQVVNFEQIAAWNPQKIFMIAFFRLSGSEVYKTLLQDKKWSMLKAVQSRELYMFPKDISSWDTPQPRWILGLMWLAAKTHPTLFKELDIRSEVYRFFKVLYGLSPSVVDEKIMPLVKLDGRG